MPVTVASKTSKAELKKSAADKNGGLAETSNHAGGRKGRDMKLLAGLKRARTQPMFFAVVVRSASVGKLLISKSKIRPSDVSEAKKTLGGGRALLGECRYQGGCYHFVLKKDPPMTLARLIKRIAKEHAKLLIKPICSRNGAEEDEAKNG